MDLMEQNSFDLGDLLDAEAEAEDAAWADSVGRRLSPPSMHHAPFSMSHVSSSAQGSGSGSPGVLVEPAAPSTPASRFSSTPSSSAASAAALPTTPQLSSPRFPEVDRGIFARQKERYEQQKKRAEEDQQQG